MKRQTIKINALGLLSLVGTAMVGTWGLSRHANAYEANPTLKQVEIPVLALLAPAVGYEEKNNIQVVLYGMLPNSCYSVGGTSIQRQADGSLHVRQFATVDSSGICVDQQKLPEHMMALIPFTTEVSVGHLSPGQYTFTYSLQNGQLGSRMLAVSKNLAPTIDTLPYAATSSVGTPDVVNGVNDVVVTVSGLLTSTCTHLDDQVKIMKENDVFVVMPTVKVQTGVMCGMVMRPFEKKVNLGKTFPGIHLIHVRSMNGKSVNKVVVVSR